MASVDDLLAAGAEPRLRSRLVSTNGFVVGLESAGETGGEVEVVGYGKRGKGMAAAMDRRGGGRVGHRPATGAVAGEGRPHGPATGGC